MITQPRPNQHAHTEGAKPPLVSVDWIKAHFAGLKNCERTDPWGSVSRDISDLRSPTLYPENWDGDGASPVSQECVTSMVALLAYLRVGGFYPPFDIYPTADGGVLAEWAFNYTPETQKRDAGLSIHIMACRPSQAEALFITHKPEFDSVFALVDY